MKKVLPAIISNEQTGFMKGRYIGENIRTIFETIDYLEKNHLPGILFFADYEKAFDSLNHDYILQCLRHFNFGDSFIHWIKLFYSDINSIIINNGHLSESFQIKHGVRQVAPYLLQFLYYAWNFY